MTGRSRRSSRSRLRSCRGSRTAGCATRRRVLGDEHPSTLTSADNLAATRWAQGDHAGARALHEEVYATLRRVLGDEHPDTLTSANNLAATRQALDDAGV